MSQAVNQAYARTAAPPDRFRGRAARVGPRRRLEMALGLLWLADGLLQWQPYMFRSAFFTNTLSMANMGLPGPVSAVLYRTTTMLSGQPVIWNALFASLQLAIGAGLLCGRTASLARPVSIVWALAVWAGGEGFGGLFMPGVSALNGAPGAALLYALTALILWPRHRPGDGPAVADAGLLGGRGALWCWTILWSGLALLELGGANHAAGVPAAEAANIGEGEPGWLAGLNRQAGHVLAGHGGLFALLAAVMAVAVGWCALRPGWRRTALAAGLTVAILYGVFGQDLGGLLTGQATDPGPAPLFVLLALALWPRRHSATLTPMTTAG
jgi:hypothetical protein